MFSFGKLTRALLRLERTMNLLKGGWGTEGGWGGDVGERRRVGREVPGRGGRDDCYTYSNR